MSNGDNLKLRENGLLTQPENESQEFTGNSQVIHSQSTDEDKRKSAHRAPRGIDRWNWPAARLFAEALKAWPHPAADLAKALHVSKPLVTAWQTEDAANHSPLAACLKISEHTEPARIFILAIAKQAGLRVQFVDEPTAEQVAEREAEDVAASEVEQFLNKALLVFRSKQRK
jgi:hypothetical protein